MEEIINRKWRDKFLEALGFHRLDECQSTLDEWLAWLNTINSNQILLFRHDHQHCVAILHFELREFDQAERIWRELLNENLTPLQRARVQLELGSTLSEQDRFVEAKQFLSQAVDSFRQVDPSNINHSLGQAQAYNNWATSLTFAVEQGIIEPDRSEKDWLEEALRHHETAIQILNELLTSQKISEDRANAEIAHNRHGQGRIYGLQHEAAKALAAFQADLNLTENEPVERAITLSDLAVYAYLPLNQREDATQALDEAIALLTTHDDLLHLAEALTRRGQLWVKKGEQAKALDDYEAAIQTVETIRKRMTAPTVQAGYRATAEAAYAAPLALHLWQGDHAQAFTMAERARSRVLADLLSGQRIQPHATLAPDLLEQRRALRLQLEQCYTQRQSEHETLSATELKPVDRQITQIETAIEAIDRQIEMSDPTYIDLQSSKALSAEEIVERLPTNAAILTFATDDNDHYWALIAIYKDGVRGKQMTSYGVKWLQEFMYNYIKEQDKLLSARTPRLQAPWLYPAFYASLIEPILPWLDGIKTLYIVPTGPLHYIPLGALTAERWGAPILLENGLRIVYTPSATVLINYCHQRERSPHQGILALAPQDSRLRITYGAARQISGLVDCQPLIGVAANQEALMTQGQMYSMLCFLGHASFNTERPMLSRLKLADGWLEASEILRRLRLNADLVVLAACESGRSHVLRGDEIMGLSRALLYAGSTSLLVTLWTVHEVPTRLIIEKLFAQLLSSDKVAQKSDTASALATAQRWLRSLTVAETRSLMTDWNDLSVDEINASLKLLWSMSHATKPLDDAGMLFAHPYFWSAYILIGEQKIE